MYVFVNSAGTWSQLAYFVSPTRKWPCQDASESTTAVQGPPTDFSLSACLVAATSSDYYGNAVGPPWSHPCTGLTQCWAG